MRYLKTLAVVALCLSLLGSPTAALAGEAIESASAARYEPAQTTLLAKAEGDTLDKITGVAAVVSILLVGAAGVYIYRLIRKGL